MERLNWIVYDKKGNESCWRDILVFIFVFITFLFLTLLFFLEEIWQKRVWHYTFPYLLCKNGKKSKDCFGFIIFPMVYTVMNKEINVMRIIFEMYITTNSVNYGYKTNTKNEKIKLFPLMSLIALLSCDICFSSTWFLFYIKIVYYYRSWENPH